MIKVITCSPEGHPDQTKVVVNKFDTIEQANRYVQICIRNKDIHPTKWIITPDVGTLHLFIVNTSNLFSL